MNRFWLWAAVLSLVSVAYIVSFARTADTNRATSASIKGHAQGIRTKKPKLSIDISLGHTVLVRRKPAIVKVRITNRSSTSLPASEFSTIVFHFAKEPIEERTRVIIGELFVSGFSQEKFVPTGPTKQFPYKLKTGAHFDYKLDLSTGVWGDGMMSSIDLRERRGLYPVPSGVHYLGAEIRSLKPGGSQEIQVVFRSSEIKVNLEP